MFKDTLLVFFNFSFGFISFSNLLLAFSWKQFRSVTLQKMEFSMKDFFFFFFLSGFSFKDYHSTTSSRSQTFKDFLQLCIWDDYYVLLIATLVFTRPLLDEIYHLIELPFDWLIDDAMFVCLLDDLILGYCYSDLT